MLLFAMTVSEKTEDREMKNSFVYTKTVATPQ